MRHAWPPGIVSDTAEESDWRAVKELGRAQKGKRQKKEDGAPSRNRTYNLRIKSPPLYLVELLAQFR
jgi:hypothetical protein